MPSAIPPRQPIFDRFNGMVLRVPCPLGTATTLDLLVNYEVEGNILASGKLIVRYGVRLLGKPHLSIVPDLIAIDYGTFLTGEEAWNFLLHRSNAYPRAEVFGFRNDGRDEMLTVKNLDLALEPETLVYTDMNATTPIAYPIALIVPDSETVPERLCGMLPYYQSMAECRASLLSD